MSSKARMSASLAVSIVVVFGSLLRTGAEPPRLFQVVEANGFPAPRCFMPLEREAVRIERLVEALPLSWPEADRNPLLLADIGYYEAELSASMRCMQSVVPQ